MRWLITGGNGMFAMELAEDLRAAGESVTAVSRDELDITDREQVLRVVVDVDVVVNAAAWVNAETAELAEPDAFSVNALGPGHVAEAAERIGAVVVHLSSDYVFGRGWSEPIPEDAPVSPLSVYGRAKSAGEWAVRALNPRHYVVRTAWLYGERGPCFPQTIARAAVARGALTVVSDQVGQPTWTKDLVRIVRQLVENEAPFGIYHGTASGAASWFEFARRTLISDGQDPEIVTPITSDQIAQNATRPPYSALGHDALVAAGIVPIGDWADRWAVAAPSVLAPLH